MSLDFMLIGRRIREVRTEQGMSQVKLAELSKTSAQYLSQIENGKKHVSLQILVSVAEVLDVSLNELLMGNQVNNSMEYQRDVAHVFADCTTYEKRVLFKMLLDTKSTLRESHKLLEKELEKY